MDQINVNSTSVSNVLKKLNLLSEELRLIISDVDKTIDNAELEGWNDAQYFAFKESFYDSKSLMINGVKRVEEDLIPTLRKILRSAEEFH